MPKRCTALPRRCLERETIDAEEVQMLIDGKELPPMRSNLATPTDTGGGDVQQVLKPESRSGPGLTRGFAFTGITICA